MLRDYKYWKKKTVTRFQIFIRMLYTWQLEFLLIWVSTDRGPISMWVVEHVHVYIKVIYSSEKFHYRGTYDCTAVKPYTVLIINNYYTLKLGKTTCFTSLYVTCCIIILWKSVKQTIDPRANIRTIFTLFV